MFKLIKESFCFDDVLLVPKHSTIISRSQVNLSVALSKNFKFNCPIVPANMKDISGTRMLEEMYLHKGLSLLHRFDTIKKQLQSMIDLKNRHGMDVFNYCGISLGIKETDKDNLKVFIDFGIKIICVDIAHLDSTLGLEMINYISDNYPDVLLIAGNVATADGANRAWKAGADIIKCGIGSSGICSTRLEAGAGVPQLTAIMNIHQERLKLEIELNKKLYFISDGGCRKTGDIVKSLCFSDMVMIGGMLSGSSATPSEEVEIDGEIYKSYAGSSTHKTNRVEGVKGLVKPKGCTADIIKKIHEGIQSGCSYQNCFNLQDLKEDPTFMQITNAGLAETNIHDVMVLQ